LVGGAFLEGKGAVVGADNFLGEAKSEAEAIDATVTGGISAVESVEYEWLLVLVDMGSSIGYEEERMVTGLAGERDLDGAVGLVIAEGVKQEVGECLAEEGPVGGYDEVGFSLECDGDIGGFSQRLDILDEFSDCLGEVHGSELEGEGAGIGLGEEE
jgi:hypothetical protein